MDELFLTTREQWRQWLEINHQSSAGIWLAYYKKASGKPRIAYDDAVAEAICFGWIDGKIRRVNDEYYKQWFTPRRPGSKWSKLNIERALKLRADGFMTPSGIKALEEAVNSPGRIYDNRTAADPEMPADLILSLKKYGPAYENFMNFSPSARKIYIQWLNSARQPGTRISRIEKISGFALNKIRPGMF